MSFTIYLGYTGDAIYVTIDKKMEIYIQMRHAGLYLHQVTRNRMWKGTYLFRKSVQKKQTTEIRSSDRTDKVLFS